MENSFDKLIPLSTPKRKEKSEKTESTLAITEKNSVIEIWREFFGGEYNSATLRNMLNYAIEKKKEELEKSEKS